MKDNFEYRIGSDTEFSSEDDIGAVGGGADTEFSSEDDIGAVGGGSDTEFSSEDDIGAVDKEGITSLFKAVFEDPEMLRSLERTVDHREVYNIYLKHIFSRKLVSVDKLLNWETRVDVIEKTLSFSGRSCLNELTTDIINIYRKVTFSSFKEKVTADVEAVNSAHAGINSATIKPSFIPKKQVDAMLKYYLKGYKAQFSEKMKSGDAKFFDDLAGQVVELLNEYIKFSWHQLHDISKGLEVLVSTGEGEYLQAVPKGVIGLIGEYVVFNDTQEAIE